MNKSLIELIFIHPDGYLPSDFPPEEATPGARFECYESRFDSPPQIGDTFTAHDFQWKVSNIFAYNSQSPSSPVKAIYEVWCHHINDPNPIRFDWGEPGNYYRYFNCQEEEIGEWGCFFDLKDLNSCVKLQPGWKLDTVQAFIPEGDRPPAGFDQIFLYWLKERQLLLSAA